MGHRKLLRSMAFVAMAVAACGDDTDTTTGTTTSEPVATTTSVASSATTSAPTTTPPPSSTSVVPTTTSTTTAPSTASPAATLGEVIASIEDDMAEQFPDPPHGRIVCDEPDDLIVHRGTVLYCDTEMPPGYEEGIWLIVITDDTGTVAYNAATDMVDLHATHGSGLSCRDLLALPHLDGQPRNDLTYLFLLAYWFQDGQPDRMDADLDGIPCETLIDPDEVETVWAGGFIY